VGLADLLDSTTRRAVVHLFGLSTLRGDKLDESSEKADTRFGPLTTVAATFFLAELGDKTMLATITIASQDRSFVGVWLGSTLGMVVADGLAILIGRVMGRQLSKGQSNMARRRSSFSPDSSPLLRRGRADLPPSRP
jgi:putative Ca2+/H+ antiporter (TMEM165/GDT1 family)